MYNNYMAIPLVSVIIPVYNTGTSAVRLAEKLLKGTYKNLDIILVDDGSTDNSLALLKKLKSPKVRIFSHSNTGPSGARNYGLTMTKGNYISFIDSDDSVAPNYIEALVSAISVPHVALVASPYLYHRLSDNTEQPVGINAPSQKCSESKTTFILKRFLHGDPIYAVNNKLFNADTIRKHHLKFDERLDFAEDTKFVLDYLAHQPGVVVFLDKPLYVYNFGTETSIVRDSNTNWAKWQVSFNNLKHWVGKHPTFKDRALLSLIHLRWRLACLRSQKGNHV